MFCKYCGVQNKVDAKFCISCGKEIGAASLENKTPVNVASATTIKCGNCGYIGVGEPVRKLFLNILAWICVCFAPLITIIYFLATHKYRCPKCRSTFVGIKNKEGVFNNQKKSIVLGFILVLFGIAILGILSSVVLVALNTAREKGRAAQATTATSGDWQPFHSVADNFDVLFPTYPKYDSSQTTTSDNPYTTDSYTADSGGTSYLLYVYKYSSALNAKPNALMQAGLNVAVNNATGYTLSSSDFTHFGQYPSLDFALSDSSDIIKGKFIVLDQSTMVLLMAESQYINQSDYEKFVNSYRP